MPGSDIIQSLATGMDVLVLLAETADGLRVKDVAEKAGIKPSVAHNVLRTLRVRGFVERDVRAPVYRLGPRIAELQTHNADHAFFQRVENAMLSLLTALPDSTATFSRPVNGEIMTLRRLNANNFGVVQKPSGFSLGLYTSASGMAVMAFCSEECYLALQQNHPFLEEAAHIWSSPGTFDERLEKIRRQGYAIHPCADEKRFASACPIYDEKLQFAGVLGVSQTATQHNTFNDEAITAMVKILKQAARQAYAGAANATT